MYLLQIFSKFRHTEFEVRFALMRFWNETPPVGVLCSSAHCCYPHNRSCAAALSTSLCKHRDASCWPVQFRPQKVQNLLCKLVSVLRVLGSMRLWEKLRSDYPARAAIQKSGSTRRT